MRCRMRSAPVRSTCTLTPGYFASNRCAISCDTLRSIEVYQTTLPSFFAAAISSGVTGVAGGAADNTRVEKDGSGGECARADQHVTA